MSHKVSRIVQRSVDILVVCLALGLSGCGAGSGSANGGEDAPAAAKTPDDAVTGSVFNQVLSSANGFPALSVESAYRAILQRDGDPGGIQGHSETVRRAGITGWLDVLRTFAKCDEFKSNILANQSNRDILERLYSGFLERGLDDGGAKAYLNLMKDGKLEDVVVIIGTSGEFYNRVFPYARMDQERFLSAAKKTFAAMLERQPTTAELDTIKEKYSYNGIRGLYEMIDSVAKGNEFLNQERPKHNDRALMDQLFRVLLARTPTDADIKRAGGEIANADYTRTVFQLVSSSEFFEKL